MKEIIKAENIMTMSSTELTEMLGFESVSSINLAIRNMFQGKIDDLVIKSSKDSRGYVVDYFLPELESKMFVAKKDINYLEKITQFWIDQNKNLSPAEKRIRMLEQMITLEREQIEIKSRVGVIETRLLETDAQLSALVEGENYFTVVGYCNVILKKVDSKMAASFGKQASIICRNEKLSIGTASHPLYGKVNTYPKEVLERVI